MPFDGPFQDTVTSGFHQMFQSWASNPEPTAQNCPRKLGPLLFAAGQPCPFRVAPCDLTLFEFCPGGPESSQARRDPC